MLLMMAMTANFLESIFILNICAAFYILTIQNKWDQNNTISTTKKFGSGGSNSKS